VERSMISTLTRKPNFIFGEEAERKSIATKNNSLRIHLSFMGTTIINIDYQSQKPREKIQ
jgi:hypothetical protein